MASDLLTHVLRAIWGLGTRDLFPDLSWALGRETIHHMGTLKDGSHVAAAILLGIVV